MVAFKRPVVSCEHWRVSHISLLSYGVMGRRKMPACPSVPGADRRADLVVIIVGDLPMMPTRCNTWDTRPCTLLGQHNRAEDVSEPLPKL